MSRKLLIIVFAAILCSKANAEEPVRYTVKSGDTLWKIASQFLGTPGDWPTLWTHNQHLPNPELIFPGDVLLISKSAIRLIRNAPLRTEKKSPQIRETRLNSAITTIDPSAIMPFLNQSIIVEKQSLKNAGYVLQGIHDEIILGKHMRFYAKGLMSSPTQRFQLFNIGRVILDPISQTQIGVEGVHLGSATLLEHAGDVSILEINQANMEIRPGDRIVARNTYPPISRYFPRPPKEPVSAQIVMVPQGVNEAARRDIVIISGGRQNQLEAGHLLEVFSDRKQIKDPLSNQFLSLPPLKIGTLMVFKTYDRLSYAILMESTSPVKVGDRVRSPTSHPYASLNPS